jgi:hypothetical protein
MAELLETRLHCAAGRRVAGHHVVASFMQRITQPGSTHRSSIPANVVRSATASGVVTLELPDRADLDPRSSITLRVFSPEGSLVGLEQIPVRALGRAQPVLLRVRKQAPARTESNAPRVGLTLMRGGPLPA